MQDFDRNDEVSDSADGNPFPVSQLESATRLKPAEVSEGRVVIEILAGGPQSRALMSFAVFWTAFSAVIFAVVLSKNPERMALLFTAPFLLIGFGMVWFAAKMRFTRTFLLLERDRLVVRSLLFGKAKTKEFPLDESSRAVLAVAYEQNDRPVHRIDVPSTNGTTAKFGTALSQSDKDWLVDGINQFLHAGPDPRASDNGDARLVGTTAAPVTPAAFQADSAVSIDFDDGHELRLSWPSLPPGKLRTGVQLFGTLAGLFLSLFIFRGLMMMWSGLQRGNWFQTVFGAVSCVIPLFMVSTITGLMFARTSVAMTAEEIRLSIGAWLFRKGKTFPLADIANVVVSDPTESTLTKITSRSKGAEWVRYINPGCVLSFSSVPTPIPLTIGQSEEMSAQVAGLIRYHLDQYNVRLPDPSTPVDLNVPRLTSE